uniref:KIB1-4 beta-propeller domain-containing protein n=1 Tax=Aegilops tauschii TaxID=37682 RepID=N1QY53_AEGTA
MLIHNPVFYSGTLPPHATSSTHRIYDGNVLPGTSDFDAGWVAGPDGSSFHRFTAHPEPTLQDLITGAVTTLPPFPEDNHGIVQRMKRNHGVVYGDGTIFLYSFVNEPAPEGRLYMPVFTAAIMRPGDTVWTVLERRLNSLPRSDNCAAYHDGKVLVWVGTDRWCIVTQDSKSNAGDINFINLEMTDDTRKDRRYMRTDNYVFASRVMVHALEEEADGNMRWVERDGRSFDDRVLFLGFPGSFTADATRLGMDGGCAYFVNRHRLFSYNLFNGEIKALESPFIGWIPPNAHVWLRPQPIVAPVQGMQERLSLHTHKNKPSTKNE